MSTLALRHLHKSYGDTSVIAELDLDIASGEFVVFVGPSGCGKSTLLRMIAGLEPITGGDLLIDGVRVNDVGPADRGLAMVFQSYALYPHMTVRANMGFALKLAGVDRAERDRAVAAAARVLDLDAVLDARPGQLSGGQRQRVAIGRAIVRRPKIFLFDEPLSNLDAALRGAMRVELARLHADLGATMIYVTHDQVEAMTMADRIVVLRGGRIEQIGTPLNVYRRPANRFVAGFIGSPTMNFLPAIVGEVGPNGCQVTLAAGATVAVALDATGLAVGEPVTLGVRPEGFAPGAGGLRGAVRLVEHLGAVSLVHAELGTGVEIVAQVPGSDCCRVGDTVALAMNPAHCHVFDTAGRALPRLERA